MFPNFRLIIVAMMASILGISCGLAVFAAFHVNRDPILLSTSGAPPLLFSNAAPITPNGPGGKLGSPLIPNLRTAFRQPQLPQQNGPFPPLASALNPTSRLTR